jgi:tryptophanyl-tRNA synthetase
VALQYALQGDISLPKLLVPQVGARIMGLDIPTQKMSKSAPRPGHAIYWLDTPDDIRAKLMRAPTASLRELRFDPLRPGVYNLLILII